MDHIKAGKQGFAGRELEGELIRLNWLVRAYLNRSDCEAGIGAKAVLRRSVFSLASSEIARAKIWRFAQAGAQADTLAGASSSYLFNRPLMRMGVILLLRALRGITESWGIRVGWRLAPGIRQWL
jgi:hypothetical protein